MATVRPLCGPISSYSRVRILHLVQSRAQRTISEICDATGLHPNTVREHLQRLIDGGYIVQEFEQRATRGRPRALYSAATGEPDATSPIARAKAEAAAERGDLLRRALPDLAGGLKSSEARQLDALIEHLEESGFEPVIDEEQLTVELSPCPHAAALPEHRPMLCQVHLGLMQGVLGEARGPLLAREVRTPSSAQECTVELERIAS